MPEVVGTGHGPVPAPSSAASIWRMRDRPGPRRDGAELQAERIASLIFLGARGGQLLFSTLMYTNDRPRYGRPLVQAGVLAGVGVESAWLARRILRARRYEDRRGMWVDTASAATALLASQRWLGDEAVAPWAKNVAIGSAIGAAAAPSSIEATGAVAALCAAALATGVRARGRDSHVAGAALAVNDALSWAGVHIATRVYLTAHRRNARARDHADELTVERVRATAAEAERARQHELLHRVTIGVLSRIAACTDLAGATSIARAEAARLRFALRNGGRVARGLDRELADIAQQSAADGLRVELVTAELTTALDAGVATLLSDATREALRAARHHGGATRAVVRAVTTDDEITVTVRDHGSGFDPAADSDYATCVRGIGASLERHGGTLSVWSEPASGVRVGLIMPLASRTPEPNGTVEAAPTAPVAASPAELIAATSAPAITFEGLAPADARLADRTLLAGLLAWRVTGLATGAVALLAGQSRHRSRSTAVLQLLIAAADSGWFAARVLARDRWSDPTAACVDAAAAAAVLALGHVNLDPADRSTWINWAPWSFAANVVSGVAMGVQRPAAAGLGGATVVGAFALQGPTFGDGLANSAALAGFFGVARSFAAQIRSGAVSLEQARLEAVDEGRRLAEAREQSAQLRLLHDHALQTLETIAAGRFADLDGVRERASQEAAQLERDVEQRHAAAGSLREALVAAIAEHSTEGLLVELSCPVADRLEPTLRRALSSATGEALTNVGKHARTGRATVTVLTSDQAVTITITDQGAGFDQGANHGGFGMNESIRARLREVGGAAATQSSPGLGTRVTLSWPA